MQLARSQGTLEEFLRSFVPIFPNSMAQTRTIRRNRALRDAPKHFILCFGELIDVVHKVDEQKLLRQCAGKARLHPKSELAISQLTLAVLLVIVNDSLVVKLRRANTQAVVAFGEANRNRSPFRKAFTTSLSETGAKPNAVSFG
jgi:hypothetical protein